ncbi:MAG: hypothetical protein IKQ97_01410 [Eubacterium sp.]|nr:hypothetical protein [Eubacterium sp.]
MDVLRKYPILDYKYYKCPKCGGYVHYDSRIEFRGCDGCDSELGLSDIDLIDVNRDAYDMYYYVNRPDNKLMLQIVYVDGNQGCSLQPIYFMDMEYDKDVLPEDTIAYSFKKEGQMFLPGADYTGTPMEGEEAFSGYSYKEQGDYIYVLEKVYNGIIPDGARFDATLEGWRETRTFRSDGVCYLNRAPAKYERKDDYIRVVYDNPWMYDMFGTVYEEYLIKVEEGWVYCFYANEKGLNHLGISLREY